MRLLVLLLVVQLVGIALAKVNIPVVHGVGKTSADPLLTTWANSFYNASQGHASAVYNTSANATIGGSINFVASENPNLSTGTASFPVPAAVYGITAVYSFSELDGTLNLTANIIAGILTGKIVSWTDQPILDQNPGITISSGPSIRLVLRNDSSETYALTNYLSYAASNWTLGAVRSIPCPAGRPCTYASNNTAVLQSVNKGANSLGFVLLGSAVTYSRVSRACVQNANGAFVSPDINGLMSAVNSTNIPTDGSTITVVNAPGNYSYPIVGFIYVYVPQDITNLGSQGTATLAFVDYILSNTTMAGTSMNFYPIPNAVDSYALSVISNVNTNTDQIPANIWPGAVTVAPTTPAPATPAATPTPASSSASTSTTGGATTTRNFAGATACSVLAAISFVACVAYDLNRRRLAGLTIIENDIYK